MGLAAELEAARAYRPHRPKCSVCLWVATLNVDDQQAFADVLADEKALTVAIHAAIVKYGADVSRQSVQRHRSGICRGVA